MSTTTFAPAAPTTTCTNPSCIDASTHRDLCECTCCDGEGHGVEFMRRYDQARADAAAKRRGNPFAGLPVMGHDALGEFFTEVSYR